LTWAKELEELRAREALAEEMGGPDKVAKQHGRGKMDARARLAALCDEGSFREIGKIAGKGHYDENGDLTGVTPAPFLFGKATVHGRPIVATADDFTIRGGAADAGISRKMVQAEKMAHELRLPIVKMIDGTGGGGSVRTLEQIGATYIPAVPGWGDVVENLDTVPVVALALGPTAGLGAARVAASHYSIMVRGLSQLFAAGPAVVDGLGDKYKSASRSPARPRKSWAASTSTPATAWSMTRSRARPRPLRGRAISSASCPNMSASSRAAPNATTPPTGARRRCSPSSRAIEKQVYSMRRALDLILDKGTVFEIGRNWGRAAITGLARLNGWPVAVVASDPSFLGGSWEARTSEKVERFVKLADQFRLPIVHLVDNPGFMIGREAEMAGTIRYGVQAMNAIYRASVPLASVVLRRAYGIAGSAMSNAERYQYRFCWPSGDWGSLPIAGGLEVAYKSDLEAVAQAGGDAQAELEKIRERLNKVTSPFRSAERFNVEDIIDPRDTRPLLCEFADLAWRKLEAE
jgi:acetyl-CoA carboxylase carboxyltransferase component